MTHVADVTIDNTTPDAQLSDYPAYVDLSDMPAGFWSTVANGGGDIRCFLPDGTELAREVVSCEYEGLVFDGSNDYVSLPWTGQPPSFDISIIFKSGAGSDKRLFSFGSSGSTFTALGSSTDGLGKLRLYSTMNLSSNIDTNGTALVFDNEVHTVRFVYTASGGSSTYKVYVDDVLDISVTTGPILTAAYFSIGALVRGSTNASFCPMTLFDFTYEGGADVRHYSSRGVTSGSSLPDLEGGTAGTLTDFPTDDSQWTAKTGELHVKIPTLSILTDTVIEIHADGTSSEPASTATYGSEAVWSDYEAVYHLTESSNNTAGGYKDSTGSYDATGVSMSSTVAGPFGTAQEFDGTSDYIDVPETVMDGVETAAKFTIQGWAKLNSTASDAALFSVWTAGVSAEQQALIYMDVDGAAAGWRTAVYSGSLGSYSTTSADASGASTSWTMVHGTYSDSANTVEVFDDGSSRSSVTTSFGIHSPTSGDARIGAADGGRYIDGAIREVRVRASVLSADWISTEYANQNDPATFYSVAAPGGIIATNIPFLSAATVETSIGSTIVTPNVDVTYT